MIFLIIFLAALVAFYYYHTRTFNYWAKKGVKHDKPIILFGTNARNFLTLESRSQAMKRMYWKYQDEKVVGFYRSSTPELVLRDPKIIKSVFISDFVYFHNRGFHPYPTNIEPVLRHVFVVENDTWRMLRQRLTSAFTSGKLKAMFPLIIDRAEKLQARTLEAAKRGAILDARDLMARYTVDFIGSVGFGLDAEALKDDDSEFRKLAFDMFNLSLLDVAKSVVKDLFPMLTQNIQLFGRIEKRMFMLVKHIMDSKGNKPTKRGDFVDMLLEYKQNGPVEFESIVKLGPDGKPEKLTMELDEALIVAQVFLFFSAGFETSASTSSSTLHQLAFNPKEQEKVQREIDEVLSRYNNTLSYDAIKEMKYLECAFKEGMRLFPALGHLMRQCTKPYTFEDINLTIDPGVRVLVSVSAIHMDPAHWDDPWEFRPERFLPNNFTSKQKDAYFPFGEGPRNCIGARLGQMQSLAGLAALLSRFTVAPAPDSVRFPDVNPISDIVQSPKGGRLPLIFTERKSTIRL